MYLSAERTKRYYLLCKCIEVLKIRIEVKSTGTFHLPVTQ